MPWTLPGDDVRYRSEIDGLRAIAVVPVILFHGGFEVFSGGFIGVDVFFVISGYLITGILIAELETGGFSIVRFYERRARRILPALFLVMLACVPFAWAWMLPSQFMDFSRSLMAVVFFVSNVLFWRESGYFAASAELKPLLHTWSLAVEEQFYLLFPLFLAVMWRIGRKHLPTTIAVLAVGSLALSEWGWRTDPTANFYLAPTRAWELLTGSLCALWLRGRQPAENGVVSAAGLGMIVASIFSFDDNTPMPSLQALLPVGGAAMIILFGGSETRVARLLSSRPLVGIGLISYSAYLWHQPLFAFARLRFPESVRHPLMLTLAAVTLVLAYLTWRHIEQPFRKGSPYLRLTPRGVFNASAAGGIVLAFIGLAGYGLNGNVFRYDGKTNSLFAHVHDWELYTWQNKNRLNLVEFRDASKPNILVIGDSNSGDLLNALMAGYGDEFEYSSITIHAGCGNIYFKADRPPELDKQAGRLECRTSGSYEGALEKRLLQEADAVFLASSWRPWEAELVQQSLAGLRDVYGDKFYVFGAKNVDFDKREIYRVGVANLGSLSLRPSSEKWEANEVVRQGAGSKFINPYSVFCPARACTLYDARHGLVYYDGSHITPYGVRILGDALYALNIPDIRQLTAVNGPGSNRTDTQTTSR